jgi:hypothetical protein
MTPDRASGGATGLPIVDIEAFENTVWCGNGVVDTGKQCDGSGGLVARYAARWWVESRGDRKATGSAAAQQVSHLVLPGLLMGAGHCFVFPSMVDLAAERLPHEHRGIGTSVILGAGDLGMLIGFAVMGQLIDAFGFDKALVALAGAVFAGTIIFALSRREAAFGRRPVARSEPA